MKVEITRRAVVGSVGYSVGEVVDLDESVAKSLIEKNNAVAVKQPKPKKVDEDGSRDG